ncbi:MAG: class I SAM-dependent methyltransferase [bacterium]|jgi:SAM-dependent methyltransferase
MTVEVLKNRTEILEARTKMRRMGIDCATSPLVSALRRIGLMHGIVLGDREKSWDVLKTVDFIRSRLPKDAPVLDIGTYASEVPCSLLQAGYTDLTGIDLNPDLRSMPHADRIRYVIGNFLKSPFDDGAFRAVTAVSVIEHGFDGGKLLAEMARLIRPGGYFLASIDYWPEKVDTNGIRAFGMDWRIFSEANLRDFLLDARRFGFSPSGEMDFAAMDRTVSWMGKRYTFAWIALRKDS